MEVWLLVLRAADTQSVLIKTAAARVGRVRPEKDKLQSDFSACIFGDS